LRKPLTDSEGAEAAGVERAPEFPRVVSFLPAGDPVASVIVIAWRDAPFLEGCLVALAQRIGDLPSEVIVAVNEPTAELLDMLDTRFDGLAVVASAENLGFGGVYNLAVPSARAPYVVLLNDDTEVCEGWLDSLVEVADRRGAAAVVSMLLDADGTIQEAGGIVWDDGWTWSVARGLPGGSARYDYERRVDYGSAASLLVRRDLFDELGGFDDRYFPATFEDADLCLRMALAGSEVWFAPRSKIVHFESQSTNTVFRQFLMDRNHAIFKERWAKELSAKEPRVRAHQPAVDRAVWRAAGARTRVLVIDDRSPDPSIGSGFGRTVELLESLGGCADFDVSFFASVIYGAESHEQLTRLGIQLIDGFLPEDLEDHLESVGVGYDIVIVSRPHNYERLIPAVRRHSSAPVVYDAEALYHRRIERQAEREADRERRDEFSAAAAIQRQAEIEIARDADFVVCLSEPEAEFFKEYGTSPVVILPPVVATAALTLTAPADRRGIGFVPGWLGGDDSPNVAALSWFATKVLPIVRELVPDVQLLITGGDPPPTATAHAGPSVTFLGKVADLGAFYDQVRVVVAPMTFGSGVKIKTMEALQHGVPVVATTIGAEGVPVTEPGGLVATDDPAEFAAAVARYLVDDEAWRAARSVIEEDVERWENGRDTAIWPGIVRKFARGNPRLVSPVEEASWGQVVADDVPLLANWMVAPPYEPTLTLAERAERLQEEFFSYLKVEVERRPAALRDELERVHERLFEAETGRLHEERRSAELDRLWAELAQAYEAQKLELAHLRRRRLIRYGDRVGERVRTLRSTARSIRRKVIGRWRTPPR
jgi:GT2 family glycosyltransferase